MKIIYAFILFILTASIYGWIYMSDSFGSFMVPPKGDHFADMESRLGRVDGFRDGKSNYNNRSYDQYGRVDSYPATWGLFQYAGLSKKMTFPLSVTLIALFLLTSCLILLTSPQ